MNLLEPQTRASESFALQGVEVAEVLDGGPQVGQAFAVRRGQSDPRRRTDVGEQPIQRFRQIVDGKGAGRSRDAS